MVLQAQINRETDKTVSKVLRFSGVAVNLHLTPIISIIRGTFWIDKRIEMEMAQKIMSLLLSKEWD